MSLQLGEFLAAIDLGSNSFHMVLAKRTPVGLKQTLCAKESVCLARGLVKDHHISEEAFAAGIACLTRFGAILKAYQIKTVRVVGTHSLRVAKNANQFITQAQTLLNHPIEIISGEEEATLTYQGLLINDDPMAHHLVIDIGGGSTELVEGKGETILQLSSLPLGCVTFSEQYFIDGKITAAGMQQTKAAVLKELAKLPKDFRAKDARVSVTSGTGQALQSLLRTLKKGKAKKITSADITELVTWLPTLKQAEKLTQYGLLPDRAQVFPAGFVILAALVEFFHIEQLHVMYGALREGLLQSMQ